MASNPRKFSEKIALHNQKQAEETAAFERIMHEVSETRYVCFVIIYVLLKKTLCFSFRYIIKNFNSISLKFILFYN